MPSKHSEVETNLEDGKVKGSGFSQLPLGPQALTERLIVIQIDTAHVIPSRLYLEVSRVTDLSTELDPDRAVVEIEIKTAVDSVVLEPWRRPPLQELLPKP